MHYYNYYGFDLTLVNLLPAQRIFPSLGVDVDGGLVSV